MALPVHFTAPKPSRRERGVALLAAALVQLGFVALFLFGVTHFHKPAHNMPDTAVIPIPKRAIPVAAEGIPAPHLHAPLQLAVEMPVFTVLPKVPAKSAVALSSAAPQDAGNGAGSTTGAALVGAGTRKPTVPCYALDLPYIVSVQNHIAMRWAHSNWTEAFGPLVMHWKSDVNGNVTLTEVVKSSGSKRLDDLMMDFMHKISPLPPIPERLHVQEAEAIETFNFRPGGRNNAGRDDSCDKP